MKKRIFSALVAACMLASLLPVSAYAEALPPATPETAQGEQPPTPAPGTEPTLAAPAEDTQTVEVAAVQAQMDALPTAEEVSSMDEIGKQGVADALTAIDDAMTAFTEKQLTALNWTRYNAAYTALTAEIELATLYDATGISGVEPDGTGTGEDPYQIANVDDLIWFANAVNGGRHTISAVLTQDIDLSEYCHPANDSGEAVSWTPIGQFDGDGSLMMIYGGYEGIFDGDGHTISGLYIENGTGAAGLFGLIRDGTVKNVGLLDVAISGADHGTVGAVAGLVVRSYQNSAMYDIENCYSTGTISGAKAGGVVGEVKNGAIKNCYSAATVSGTHAGGVVGYAYTQYRDSSCSPNPNAVCEGTIGIKNCYSTGAVTGSDSAGGVVGYAKSDFAEFPDEPYYPGDPSIPGELPNPSYPGGGSTPMVTLRGNLSIDDCYSTASVSGSSSAGGVVGFAHKDTDSFMDVNRCVALNPSVSCGESGRAGAVVGDESYMLDPECYYWNLISVMRGGAAIEPDAVPDSRNKPLSLKEGFLYEGATKVAWTGTAGIFSYENVWVEPTAPYALPYLVGSSDRPTMPACSSGHIDDNGDGYCDRCKIIADGIAAVAGYALNIQGTIGIKFYMDLGEKALAEGANTAMHFTVENKEETVVPLDEAVKDTTTVPGKTLYVFTRRIGAEQMTDTVSGYITAGEETGKTFTETVGQYSKSVLNGEQQEKVKQFINAMLQYGAYSQIYIGHKGNDLVATLDTNVQNITAEELKDHQGDSQKSNTAIGTFVGTSLTIYDETTLRYYFKLADGVDVTDVTFKLGDTILTPKMVGGYVCASVENINAKQLDNVYTVTATKGEQTLSVNYSALAYAYQVLSSSQGDTINEKLQNLMRALYLYNVAAKAYAA